MTDFRIMPAQRYDLMPYSGTRYGFPIFNHPLNDPGAGFYVASWDKREKAVAAAHCLGYLPTVVVAIGYVVPNTFDDDPANAPAWSRTSFNAEKSR